MRPVPPARRIALALAALAAGACSRPADDGAPRHALLITLTSTRADALGRYGRLPSVTPKLDALARDGVTYTNAHTVAPLSLPAHASMLTGLVPLRHSVRDASRGALPDAATTVAELAQVRDFDTAAFVSSSRLDRSFGLDQGFAVYDAPARPPDGSSGRVAERGSGETVRAVARWLAARDGSRRFVLWVHLSDPHAPYEPSETFLRRAGGDPYLGEVAAADDAVGELLALLDEAGELASTLVIVAADHGEGRGEHGEPTHGAFCYESTLRVPLLVRYPDLHRHGESADRAASVADVAPTLIEALDLGSCYGLDGVSLYRRQIPEGRGVYFESYAGFLDHGWSPLAGRIEDSTKYIASSSPELYDLAVDPSEARNLLPGREADRRRFEEAIAELARRPALEHDPWNPIDPELVRGLHELGLARARTSLGVLPGPLERVDLPAPAERTAELQACTEAAALLSAGAAAEAVAALEPVVAANPVNVVALDLISEALLELDRCDEARARLEQCLQVEALRPASHFRLATCLAELGQPDAARTHASIAKRLGHPASQVDALLARLGAAKK